MKMDKDGKRYINAINAFERAAEQLRNAPTTEMAYDDVVDSGVVIESYERIQVALEDLERVGIPFEQVMKRMNGDGK